jgi:hypothetical protein
MNMTGEAEARDILNAAKVALAPYVRVTADGIIIASGYSEALARLLRWVPKAAWRPEKRGWLVPLSGADAMRSVLPEIIRLAEAAADERSAENATSKALSLGDDWLPELSRAIDHSSDEIAALLLAGGVSKYALSEVAALVATLRDEASRILRSADRLEAFVASKK